MLLFGMIKLSAFISENAMISEGILLQLVSDHKFLTFTIPISYYIVHGNSEALYRVVSFISNGISTKCLNSLSALNIN